MSDDGQTKRGPSGRAIGIDGLEWHPRHTCPLGGCPYCVRDAPHARRYAEAMAEAMDAPPTTPAAWRYAGDAWQAGYRQGLADARVIVAGESEATDERREWLQRRADHLRRSPGSDFQVRGVSGADLDRSELAAIEREIQRVDEHGFSDDGLPPVTWPYPGGPC